MIISTKLSGFHTEIANSIPYIALPANTLRLEVTMGWNAKAAIKFADYNTKWGVYSSPATHTDQSSNDLNASYDDFHPWLEKKKNRFQE